MKTGAVFQNWSALGAMAGGIGFSLLLGALILVLATGRIRALVLVREKTDELQHQALHDVLTGLPNRALIIDRTEQLLARSRRNATSGATLFIDLDGFKNVNDTLGHEAGDRLLQLVAERLTATLRDADTIGRMGGDEFVVLIDGGSLDVGPELVAERLLEVMRQPFALADAPAPIVITASIGIAVASDRTPRRTRCATPIWPCTEAKAAGRNCYEIFRPEMEANHPAIGTNWSSTSAPRSDDHQFRLVYQPIYNLDDLSVVGRRSPDPMGAPHPRRDSTRRLRPPPRVQRTDCRQWDVGCWSKPCTQIAAWRERGQRSHRVGQRLRSPARP